MPAPKVRGEYDELQQIASIFAVQAERSQRSLRQIKSQVETLQGGDWIGQGAQAFYKEMDQQVLPALNRLVEALNQAQQTTKQISKIVQETEETTARLLGGAGMFAAMQDGRGPGAEAAAEEAGEAGGEGEAGEAMEPLTVEQLREAMPTLSEERAAELLPQLNSAMEEFDINTPERRRMFLAQIGHESADLSVLSENLNYSEERLLEVFPGYFDEETAGEYAGQPERIANRVYADRMGNGDEDSGDGWRYRGRGAMQITGRDNYEAVGEALELDLVNHPELLEQPGNAMRAAAWWWENAGLNETVDANPNDVEAVTRVINGGTHGLDDRQARFDRLAPEPEPEE